MTEVSVYHLTTTPLEKTLPKLLEKVMELGKRSIVMAASDARVESLNTILWTYSTNKFLPHGSKKDGMAEHQPIWLTTESENPNDATVLFLTDGVDTTSIDEFERCIDIFDGADETAEVLAQQRVQSYIMSGHTVTYWLQGMKGNWEKKQ